MGCFLDDLRAFGINTDQWTTAPQDERKWRRTAKQGTKHFMAKWIAAEKARVGLRHAVVCPIVARTTKERIAQSKRAGADSFAISAYATHSAASGSKPSNCTTDRALPSSSNSGC